jgi:hypothetical protein
LPTDELQLSEQSCNCGVGISFEQAEHRTHLVELRFIALSGYGKGCSPVHSHIDAFPLFANRCSPSEVAEKLAARALD